MNTFRALPRTVHLCIHCQHNPAGLWVSRRGATLVRRPWCLTCCQHLHPDRYHVIPFDAARARGPDGASRRTPDPQGRNRVFKLPTALTGRTRTAPGRRRAHPLCSPGTRPAPDRYPDERTPS